MKPKLKTRVGETVGVELFIPCPEIQSFKKTYLSADESVGQSELSVESGVGFSVGEYSVVGNIGAEKTEIVRIHTSTVPTATAITLNAISVFAHSRGDLVSFIPYNQIVIERSTDSGVNYSVLATINIRVDAFESYYIDTTGLSTYYYRVRFLNEAGTTYSSYSDGIVATGFVYNSVGAIKKRALDQIGETATGIITDSFLNESLWEGRRTIDKALKRWSFRTAFNYDAGNVVEGAYSIAVPATLRNPDSPQNILSIRIGNTGRHIGYVDKLSFDRWYEGIAHTTVATQPLVGATTLTLTSCRDISDSGSVTIGNNTITYTSKVDSTGVISGIPASGTGSIDATHAVGTDVWQNASFGEPMNYTIFEDTIFFNTPFDGTYDGNNIFMDFYRTLPDYDSDADVLDEPDPDMLVSYLKHKIKERKEKDKYDITKDSSYARFTQDLSTMIRKERAHQGTGFIPDIGHLIGQD